MYTHDTSQVRKQETGFKVDLGKAVGTNWYPDSGCCDTKGTKGSYYRSLRGQTDTRVQEHVITNIFSGAIVSKQSQKQCALQT